jgi:flavin reductase (DIM6/NTAB) family NADH-FMN oxidoreductase RutF
VAFRRGGNGAPILNGTLAHLECKLHATYEGGDHTIYLGLIDEAETREVKPLLFFRGGYRELGD